MWTFYCDSFLRIYLVLLFPLCNDLRAAAVKDEVERVEVTEGATVPLKTDWTGIKEDDIILWSFGIKETRIARLFNKVTSTHYDERFRDRIQLDTLTGSLTISNIRPSHSGIYKVQLSSDTISNKHFSVTVYATLPKPNITHESSQSRSVFRKSSIPGCSVVCSVRNAYSVTLSWYNESYLLSSSDTNTSILSLPLHVEYGDNNIYSCVAANPIINQTVQLNQTKDCPYTNQTAPPDILRWLIPVLLLLLVVIVVVIYLLYLKSSKRSTVNAFVCLPAIQCASQEQGT